jgi:pimeloyl-ACP methyl ester carboxylesterase
MKPRLLILSDLFGGKNPEWIKTYFDLLEPKFDIQYYDVLELGGIDKSNFAESNLHNQFLNGGIDKAVDTLLQLEKGKVTVLGFSIGGTIAWKASLKGMNAISLFAVSSTRLRYETESPNCELKLYFGEKDSNKPNSQWFLDLKISNEILQNQNHQLYLEKNNASLICNEILAI